MRNNVEYFEQCAVMSWANLQKCKYPELNYLHCSLAGIFLPPGLAKKLKQVEIKLEYVIYFYHVSLKIWYTLGYI